jgi:hypothetical protein
MKLFKKLQTLVYLLVAQLMFASFALAAVNTTGLKEQDDALIGNSGLAGNSNLATILSMLIKTVLGFLGIVFLVLTIMAGFKWMMAQGNEDEIKKAQSSLKNSVIGLLIVLAAYAITYAVFTYMPFASGGTGSGSGGAL